MPAKLKCKLETARTFINTPSSTKCTRKSPKLSNTTTTLIIKRKRCSPKRELWARLHSKTC